MASRRPTDSPRTPAAAVPTTPAVPVAESESPPAKTKSATTRKPRTKKVAPTTTVPAALGISEDVRRGMIAEAAYLRAERRGFTGGPDKEREDWLAAETEVDALLRAGHGSPAQ